MTDGDVARQWDEAVKRTRDLAAEQSVIGGCFLRPVVLDWLDLEPEAFFDMRNARVWAAMQSLVSRRIAVDEITVGAELERMGVLEAIGGPSYLGELMLRVPTVDNLVHYAETLRAKLKTRRLLYLASSLPGRVLDGTMGEELLDDVQVGLRELEEANRAGGASLADLAQREVVAAVEFAERVAKGSKELVGIPTGIAPIDQRTGGLPMGVPSVVGARPGNGKSSLALCVALRAARMGLGVHVVTYEDRGPIWAARALSQESDVPVTNIASRTFTRQDFGPMTAAATTLRDTTRLWIDHGHGLPVDRVMRMHRARRREIDTKLVILDYLQRVPAMPHERGWKRHEQLTSVLNAYAELAGVEGVAVLLFSQLNRDASDQRPTLRDFKDCGAIEEVGKLIIALHPARVENELEMMILKNHNGPTAQVIARWDRPRCWIG